MLRGHLLSLAGTKRPAIDQIRIMGVFFLLENIAGLLAVSISSVVVIGSVTNCIRFKLDDTTESKEAKRSDFRLYPPLIKGSDNTENVGEHWIPGNNA